jgi:hypothetical protein
VNIWMNRGRSFSPQQRIFHTTTNFSPNYILCHLGQKLSVSQKPWTCRPLEFYGSPAQSQIQDVWWRRCPGRRRVRTASLG